MPGSAVRLPRPRIRPHVWVGLMYIFMFLYLFLERAGNPLDFAMMGRGFQRAPACGLAACKTLASHELSASLAGHRGLCQDHCSCATRFWGRCRLLAQLRSAAALMGKKTARGQSGRKPPKGARGVAASRRAPSSCTSPTTCRPSSANSCVRSAPADDDGHAGATEAGEV